MVGRLGGSGGWAVEGIWPTRNPARTAEFKFKREACPAIGVVQPAARSGRHTVLRSVCRNAVASSQRPEELPLVRKPSAAGTISGSSPSRNSRRTSRFRPIIRVRHSRTLLPKRLHYPGATGADSGRRLRIGAGLRIGSRLRQTLLSSDNHLHRGRRACSFARHLGAPIAQLDRASDYGSEGCKFNSYWVHHSHNQPLTTTFFNSFLRVLSHCFLTF